VTAVAASGRSQASIAREFGVSKDSVHRHLREQHVAPSSLPVKAVARPKTAPGATQSHAFDPLGTFVRAFGVDPMTWQQDYLTETKNLVLLKGRQVGATQGAAALGIDLAMSKPGALATIVSPSLRQSTEITTRARLGLWEMGERLRQDSTSLLRLANGSRIISLPGSAKGIRGYPADLVILDEAAWISDDAFVAARAMTAATKGRIVVQSTPGAEVGFFWELATKPPAAWRFMKVRSDEVGTIEAEFLAREEAEMTPAMFAQEYMCQFAPAESAIEGFWTAEDWERIKDDSVPLLEDRLREIEEAGGTYAGVR
jgi:hypothetical protein